MPLTPEVLDTLLKEYKTPDDLLGDSGLLKQLTRALVERAMDAEMTHHPGYKRHDPAGHHCGNSRNGKYPKTLTSEYGEMTVAVPRDRAASFELQLIKKGQRRFDGFDGKVLSMYARGMTVREIQGHLQELYGVEVSLDLISSVTDAVVDEVKAWQARPLDPVYPILFLDALQVKIRTDGRVANKAVYSVFPRTQVQLCIVHMVRNSLAHVSFKDRKAVAAGLRQVYHAATADEAERQLEMFAAEWDARYPLIARSWRANWSRLIPMFGCPEEIRRAIYTTNVIESLNMTLRKVVKTRASFPNDDAAFKVLYLALHNIAKKWTMPIPNWSHAITAFVIIFKNRVPLGALNSFTQTI